METRKITVKLDGEDFAILTNEADSNLVNITYVAPNEIQGVSIRKVAYCYGDKKTVDLSELVSTIKDAVELYTESKNDALKASMKAQEDFFAEAKGIEAIDGVTIIGIGSSFNNV